MIAPVVVVSALGAGLCTLVIVLTATSAAAAARTTPPVDTQLGATILVAALVSVAVALAAVAQFIRLQPRYRRTRSGS